MLIRYYHIVSDIWQPLHHTFQIGHIEDQGKPILNEIVNFVVVVAASKKQKYPSNFYLGI